MAMTEPSDLTRWQLKQIRSALELLAADAGMQAEHLAELGVSPSLDELALEFEDARGLVPGLVRDGLLPAEIQGIVDEMAATLQAMTIDRGLWSLEALGRHAWQSVRVHASRALKLVGEQ